LDALYIEQFFPKMVGESGISVRDNIIRHAMKLDDIIHEHLSHCGCSKWVLNNTKMSIFGDMIVDHHDELLISRFR
jgi:hypothetical protein